jgi:uncharacterized protein (TIGR00255 family)
MQSMTGFGRVESSFNGFNVVIEARSVNYRSLSVTLKLPEVVIDKEPEVRKLIDSMFQRGRIRLDAFIKSDSEIASGVNICLETAKQYIAAAETLSSENEGVVVNSLSAGELLNLPGVVTRSEALHSRELELGEAFTSSVAAVLSELAESRSREGTVLQALFRNGFTNIRELSVPLLALQAESVQERFARLKKRVSDLIDDIRIDEDRMMQELALLADRCDITEEADRLSCHLDHALELVDSGNTAIGRKLEFIIQEMHRELNTMGSKVDDPQQSLKVIEMKNILSSLKEQAANIE